MVRGLVLIVTGEKAFALLAELPVMVRMAVWIVWGVNDFEPVLAPVMVNGWVLITLAAEGFAGEVTGLGVEKFRGCTAVALVLAGAADWDDPSTAIAQKAIMIMAAADIPDFIFTPFYPNAKLIVLSFPGSGVLANNSFGFMAPRPCL
jgi:hypothetical protein